MQSLPLRIAEPEVSGVLLAPASPQACFVFAHGAGAGMTHRSMNVVAEGLAQRRIATLRYQFPYMERRWKRTDAPAICHATVRAAVIAAAEQLPNVPLFAGGRSFGGRMTSQAQALSPLTNVRGLILLGFPLHPAGKPSTERAKHLADAKVPMLFIQGTRDDLAESELLKPTIAALGGRAMLHMLDAADHSFHVLARSGRNDAEVNNEACDAIAAFCLKHSSDASTAGGSTQVLSPHLSQVR